MAASVAPCAAGAPLGPEARPDAVPAEHPRDEAERRHPSRVLWAPQGAVPAAWPDEPPDPYSARAEQLARQAWVPLVQRQPPGRRPSARPTAALVPAPVPLRPEPRAWEASQPDAAQSRSHQFAAARSLHSSRREPERQVAERPDQEPPDPDAQECQAGATAVEAAALRPDRKHAEPAPALAVGPPAWVPGADP